MQFIYEGEIYDYIYDDIRGKLVFDIGSNIGQMVKRFINVNSKVVAVEPQSELTSHENYNGVFAIKHVCVSNEIGNSIFYKCSDNTMSSCNEDRKNWEICSSSTKEWTETSIQTITLDSLIEEFGVPSYIKVDVEGLEDKVFEGLNHKVNLISFEFVKDNEENTIKCLKILDKKFGIKKLMPFIKKKVKDNQKRIIKLHAYSGEYYDIKGMKQYLYEEFPKLIKKANRYVGDILVIL